MSKAANNCVHSVMSVICITGVWTLGHQLWSVVPAGFFGKLVPSWWHCRIEGWNKEVTAISCPLSSFSECPDHFQVFECTLPICTQWNVLVLSMDGKFHKILHVGQHAKPPLRPRSRTFPVLQQARVCPSDQCLATSPFVPRAQVCLLFLSMFGVFYSI